MQFPPVHLELAWLRNEPSPLLNIMKATDVAIECLTEFSGIQPNGALDALQLPRDGGLPSMLRAANGMEIWFSPRALECVEWLARHLHQESKAESIIRIEEYAYLVRQVLVDGYCDGRLTDDNPALLADLRSMVATSLEAAQRPLIHSYPAWSVDVGNQAIQVGPVTIYPLELWLERQQFTPKVSAAFFAAELPEEGWKARFRAYLSGELQPQHIDPACMLAHAVGDTSHVVEVAMTPKEIALSRQQARLLAQSALDVIALILDQPKYHRHWVLRDQPSAPESFDDITAFESGLWPANAHKRIHRSPFSVAQNRAMLDRYASHLVASGHVLDVVRNFDSKAANIGLAQRWFTALLWAAQGAREPNDAMASAKFASSLDILAQANGDHPIVELVSNLLGINADVVVSKPTPSAPVGMSLKQVVKRIYGEGRSQVLHGNIVNPMHRHALERNMGGWLARNCLRTAVLAIPTTSDSEHANFRTLRLHRTGCVDSSP